LNSPPGGRKISGESTTFLARRDWRRPTAGLLVALGLCWAGARIGAAWLVVSEPVFPAEALLVMAGASVYMERVQHAGRLLLDGHGKRLLLTDDGSRQRWSRALQRNPSSLELALGALQEQGVPADRVDVLPGRVHSTYDETQAAVQYANAHGLGSLVAVTSPYHTRRTLWTLRRSAGSAIRTGTVAAPFSSTTPSPSTWWTTRAGWRTVGAEFVKLPYYWLRYR
jgi:uncharacterized SAM-binding protein YcdF (DUF218 family)